MDLFERYHHFNFVLFETNFDMILDKNLFTKFKLKEFPLRHMHRSWELYYVSSGYIEVDVGEERKVYHEGTFTFIPPNTEHCIVGISPDEKHYSIRLSFTNESQKNIYTDIAAAIREHSFVENKTNDDIDSSFAQLRSYYKRFINNNPNVWIDQKVTVSCMMFLTNLIESICDKSIDWKKQTTADSEKLTMLIEFFTEQKESVSLKSLARSLNYSVSQTNRLLKNKYGTSFQELRNEVRISKSKYYLSQTDIPIDEISEIIGFKRRKYFDSFFKNQVGVTPLKFRKTNQKRDSSNHS